MHRTLRNRIVLCVVLQASVLCLPQAGRGGSIDDNDAPATAFINVNVVPMDKEAVMEAMTVIVTGDRITAIDPADLAMVPAGANRIDGTGRFLMPGLADMHVHLGPGTGDNNDAASIQLKLLLANGVTTARSMIGHPSHPALRDRVAKGQVPGPMLICAGPPLLGQNTPTPESGEQAVLDQKAAGFDLLKVHENLSPETYRAIVAKARAEKMPFAGHATATVGLKLALESRQRSIEHLDGYLQALVPPDAPVKPSGSQFLFGPALQFVDETRLPALAKETARTEVWNTPTLTLFDLVSSDVTAEELLKWPEMKYASSKLKEVFARQKAMPLPVPLAERERFLELRRKVVVELHKAGAKLLVGPDSPQVFLIPGFATHRELRSLVDAGLSPYAALEAGTRSAAEYLDTPKEFGTVRPGGRADLVLLEDNPLTDIANANRRVGVMLRGRWFPASELQAMLDEVEKVLKGV